MCSTSNKYGFNFKINIKFFIYFSQLLTESQSSLECSFSALVSVWVLPIANRRKPRLNGIDYGFAPVSEVSRDEIKQWKFCEQSSSCSLRLP